MMQPWDIVLIELTGEPDYKNNKSRVSGAGTGWWVGHVKNRSKLDALANSESGIGFLVENYSLGHHFWHG